MLPGEYYTYNDADLFELMRGDDELAFRVIYERYRKQLLANVYNGLHAEGASEEVIQDVFYWLWAKRKTTKVATSLKGYLYMACRNAMLNVIRSDKMKKAYAADLSRFASGLLDNSNVEYQNIRDLENVIETSLSALPRKCQTVFRMSRKEHIPISNIAQQLNISTKRVENYITEALKHLRTSLGEFMVIVILMKLW